MDEEWVAQQGQQARATENEEAGQGDDGAFEWHQDTTATLGPVRSMRVATCSSEIAFPEGVPQDEDERADVVPVLGLCHERGVSIWALQRQGSRCLAVFSEGSSADTGSCPRAGPPQAWPGHQLGQSAALAWQLAW